MVEQSLHPVVRHIRKLAGGREELQLSDLELLKRFVSGRDEAAFALLVKRHGPMVHDVCRRWLRQDADADDAFQATFLVLLRRAHTIRKGRSLACWLYGVAYHVASQARRAAVRRRKGERRSEQCCADDPAKETAWREIGAALDAEMNSLGERYRAPLVFCYVQGHTRDEAARELGLSLRTLDRRLERGRVLLRSRLARRGLTLSAALVALGLTRQTSSAASSSTEAGAALRTGIEFITGKTAPGTTGKAAALAATVLRGMGLARMKVLAALVVAAGLVATGAGVLARHALAEREPVPAQEGLALPVARNTGPARADQPESAGVDRYGDTLPPGALARLGTVRFRHEGEALSLVFSPDGKMLAARSGNTVLWDARTGKELRRIATTGTVDIDRLIDFSPDSKILAGLHDGYQIGLWDAATGKLLDVVALPGVNGPKSPLEGAGVSTIRFSPNGKFLAVASGCNACSVLDVRSRTVLHHFKQCTASLTFSPDSDILVTGVSDAWPSQACRLRMRDVRTGQILREQEGHPDMIRAMSFSADGKTLATGSIDRIILWDADGNARTRIEKKMGQVTNLAFTPDGRTLVSGSEDGLVLAWDVGTGKERQQFGPRVGGLRSMALSPDGARVAAGTVHSALRLWDLATGRDLLSEYQGHDAQVNSVAYSSDGKLLVTGGENRQVWIWNVATNQPEQSFHGESVRLVAFSPGGQRLALLGGGKYFPAKLIRVLEAATGKELFRLTAADAHEFRALAFSPDGKTLVSADWNAPTGGQVTCGIKVWEASTGPRLHRFVLTDIRPECLAISPDGRTLALAGCCDRDSIRLCDLGSGQQTLSFRGGQVVETIAFSPDGRRLVSAAEDGSESADVRLWEVATGKEIQAIREPTQAVHAIAFSPRGRIIAWDGVASHASSKPRSPVIHLWDTATGEFIRDLQGYESTISSLAFSPDGARLASGLQNSSVLIWGAGPECRVRQRETSHLGPEELAVLWSKLAADDARAGHQAIWRLVAAPSETIPWLKDHLESATAVDRERVRRLIGDLNSDRFALRRTAMNELGRLKQENEVQVALRQALADKPSLEMRQRLEALLLGGTALHAGDLLRGVRGVEVLERIGTAEARHLLETIARGTHEARLTQEAKASLERLAQTDSR